MDYFYCEPSNIGEGTLVIGGDEFAHLTHVMRKKEGDRIVAVDGRGAAYETIIESVGKRAATCRILSRHDRFHEPDVSLTLAVGVLKNPSRFDFLVEKTTELGVSEIIPVATERTIPSRAKSARWRKLALSAMKQSGRSYLPAVRDLTPLAAVFSECARFGRRIVAHEKRTGEGPPSPAGLPGTGILLLVGPEGGFSDAEVELCARHGFETLYLGERRLRTETAAIVAAALVMR